MSYLASLMEKKSLMFRRSDIQWTLSLLGRSISALQKSCSDLIQVGADYEADSVMAKKLLARQRKLKIIEDQLEQQQSALKTELKQVEAEIEYCDSIISSERTKFFNPSDGSK